MGPDQCGKSYFLSSLVNIKLKEKKKKEKYQTKWVYDAFTVFDLDYGKYTIQFSEVLNHKRIFQDCIKFASQADGIILMYSLKKDFPIYIRLRKKEKKSKIKIKNQLLYLFCKMKGLNLI